MDLHNRYITGILFLSLSISAQAQSVTSPLRSSIKDDIRRDLLKQVKPAQAIPGSAMKQSTTTNRAIREETLEDFSKKYIIGTGGSEYDDKYQISPHVTTYNSSVPINKLPDGYVFPVFTGGHWILTNPTTRVDGLVVPSGMNLSGGGKKPMSEKSKSILKNVFGMEVEE